MDTKHKLQYESPVMEVLEFRNEKAFCMSTNVSLEDPFYYNDEEDW